MKKAIVIMLAIGLLAAPSAARAGDHGWATAGKILTGVIGLHILGHAIADSYEPYYYAPAPRTYYAPPPEQVWVPGRYETRYRRQWVPGHWEVERDYRHGEDDEDDDGYSRGRRVWVPGRYEETPTRVWLPGHWEERG